MNASTETATAAAAESRLFRGGISDWALFLLAVISLGLLTWASFTRLTADQFFWVRVIDSAICLVFAIELTLHWRLAGWNAAYVRRNWYAVLGIIPAAHPVVFAVPALVALLLVIRLARALDRVLGAGFTWRLLNRVRELVVNAISGVVTIAVLNEVADVLVKGTYTRNISRALTENQDELRAMVMEKLRDDPQTGKLAWVPYHNEIAASVIDTVLRVTEEILKDPRTDQLVADLLRENISQLRAAVENVHRDDPIVNPPVERSANV